MNHRDSQTMATATTRTEAPQKRRSRLMRRAILDGAKRVFMAGGYGASSMDAVAEAAGVSKMTVYRHFNSKQALFAGVIEDLCEKMMDGDLAADMAGLPTADALAQFARRFIATVFDPETIVLHRIVIAEIARFPELGRLFYESGPAQNVTALAGYLAEHADECSLAREDPVYAAESFLEQLRGYAHLRQLMAVSPPPDAARREVLIARVIKRFLTD
jgi:TetR/AcrR family transcriptional regulator, mexJK operon transcriptional repressor